MPTGRTHLHSSQPGGLTLDAIARRAMLVRTFRYFNHVRAAVIMASTGKKQVKQASR